MPIADRGIEHQVPAVLRQLRWHALLDNYEPHRSFANGYAVLMAGDETRSETVVLDGAAQFADAYKAIYLLDDGADVGAWYVSGWSQEGNDRVFLQPFPVNPDGRTRDDTGRVIDYDSWMIGPRRAYHLKIDVTT